MNIQELPTELLQDILIRLDIGSGAHASLLVCKQWYAVSNSEQCWKLRCIRKFGCPEQLDIEAAYRNLHFGLNDVCCWHCGNQSSYEYHTMFCPKFYNAGECSWKQHAIFWSTPGCYKEFYGNFEIMAAHTGHRRMFSPKFNVHNNRLEFSIIAAAANYHKDCLLKCFAAISKSYVRESALYISLHAFIVKQAKTPSDHLCIDFLKLEIDHRRKSPVHTEEQLCDYFTRLFQLGVNPNECHSHFVDALLAGHTNVVRVFFESGYQHAHLLPYALGSYSIRFKFLRRECWNDMKKKVLYSYFMCLLYEGSIWGSVELLHCFEEHARAGWWPAILGEALAYAVRQLNIVFIANVVAEYRQKACWTKIFWNYKHFLLDTLNFCEFKTLRNTQSQLSDDEFCYRLLNLYSIESCSPQLLFLFCIRLYQVDSHRSFADLHPLYHKLNKAVGVQGFIICSDCINHLLPCSFTLTCPLQEVPEPESYIQNCMLCIAGNCDIPVRNIEKDEPFNVLWAVCPSMPTNCIVFADSNFYAINIGNTNRNKRRKTTF